MAMNQKVNVMADLGVDDPEMGIIEEVLNKYGIPYQYAMKDGQRVHPGNAYKADAVDFHGTLLLIECEPVSWPADATIVRIDHHRKGDPGYEVSGYKGSSLYQLYEYLGVPFSEIPHEHFVLMVMDHCPAAGMRNECFDQAAGAASVTAQEIFALKVSEIAKKTHHSQEEVKECIAFFTTMIPSLPLLEMGDSSLFDLRDRYVGEGYSFDLLCAQTAALAEGYTIMLYHRDRVGAPDKWSISGHATTNLIKAFMQEWGPAHKLVGIYGVPKYRGYAGGYLE